MSKSDYIGRIENAGSQVVKAPNQTKSGTGNGSVKTGGDLRTGGKKK